MKDFWRAPLALSLSDHTLRTAPPPPSLQVPVQSWFDDMTDTELLDLIPLLEGLSKEEDVYSQLQSLRNR